MTELAQEQMKGVKPEHLTKLIELWANQAKAIGYDVHFYPSGEFDEILKKSDEEGNAGFSEDRRPHIDGAIDLYYRDIYIREDADPADQLCALIHETLHAELPQHGEPEVHTMTLVEMERIRNDPEEAIAVMKANAQGRVDDDALVNFDDDDDDE